VLLLALREQHSTRRGAQGRAVITFSQPGGAVGLMTYRNGPQFVSEQVRDPSMGRALPVATSRSIAALLRSAPFPTAQASFRPVVAAGSCGEQQPRPECRLGDDAAVICSVIGSVSGR
jgi:hypothetical protein